MNRPRPRPASRSAAAAAAADADPPQPAGDPRALQHGFTLALLISALLLGWLIHDRLRLFQSGLRLEGTVLAMPVSDERIAGSHPSSTRHATRLDLIVQVPDPDQPGQTLRFRELAPVLHLWVETGQRLPVLLAPLRRDDEPLLVAAPAQLALPFVLAGGWLLGLWAMSRAAYQHSRRPRRLYALLLAALLLPPLIGQLPVWRAQAARAEDQRIEASWPAWPELEAAAPRPWWWSQLSWQGMDPLSADPDAIARHRQRLDAGGRPGQAQGHYKLDHALMLRERADPQAMAVRLSTGGTRSGHLPLYRFYLDHFLDARWQSPHTPRNNDRNLMTELAATVIYMEVQAGRVSPALALAERLLALEKVQGADDAETQQRFVRAYCGALQALHGRALARDMVQPLISEGIAAAERRGDHAALRSWQDIWSRAVPEPSGALQP